MKLQSRTSIIGAALLALAFLGSNAKADPINGTIDFGGGGATTDTGSLSTATAFTSISGVTVSGGVVSPTGSYSAVTVGDVVNFNTFSFTDASITSIPNLWSFTDNGITYSFDASSVAIQAPQGVNGLTLYGEGTAYIIGGSINDIGVGSWSITDTGVTGPDFTFSAATAVPDSGSTALLIALGLAGIGAGVVAKRRKLAMV